MTEVKRHVTITDEEGVVIEHYTLGIVDAQALNAKTVTLWTAWQMSQTGSTNWYDEETEA